MKTFTHLSILDPDWQPGPGQKYRDAPKALCRVFYTTKTTVWLGYADSKRSSWRMDRPVFEERYPGII
jgi:hypothetical protein